MSLREGISHCQCQCLFRYTICWTFIFFLIFDCLVHPSALQFSAIIRAVVAESDSVIRFGEERGERSQVLLWLCRIMELSSRNSSCNRPPRPIDFPWLASLSLLRTCEFLDSSLFSFLIIFFICCPKYAEALVLTGSEFCNVCKVFWIVSKDFNLNGGYRWNRCFAPIFFLGSTYIFIKWIISFVLVSQFEFGSFNFIE